MSQRPSRQVSKVAVTSQMLCAVTYVNRKDLVALLAIPALAVLALPIIWAVLYFGVYIGYGNHKVRGHQEFAANGGMSAHCHPFKASSHRSKGSAG